MEKRYFPRVLSQLSVIITNEDGFQINVSTLDISSDGLSIQCSIHQRNKMTPGGSYIRNRRPVELLLTLELPEQESSVSHIESRCHITFSRRIAKDLCQIGLRFVSLDESARAELTQYIESMMETSSLAMG